MIKKNFIEFNLAGEVRRFYLGIGFLSLYVDETGKSIEELESLNEKNPFKEVPTLMYYALKYGYIRQNKEMGLTYHEFLDWLDDADAFSTGIFSQFSEAFTGALSSGTPKVEEKGTNKTPPKKKRT